MKITSISATNYKSLRAVTWNPKALTVVMGANASGKSNFADFHDFISDVYRHGLPVAVARKGGYENIAHRKKRRSRSAMRVRIEAELAAADFRGISPDTSLPDKITFEHYFAFRAETRGISADFQIEEEHLALKQKLNRQSIPFLQITRTKNSVKHHRASVALPTTTSDSVNPYEFLNRQLRMLETFEDFFDFSDFPSTELVMEAFGRFIPIFGQISNRLSEIRVFQFSPTNTREFGVPIPNPEMDVHGGNLPAVVDMISKRHKESWNTILSMMRKIIPRLDRIEVDYTHSRTLGLFFYESGIGRPWTVSEISDGTIHSLAILVAFFDPRTTMLILEEPENSVHTWILRNLMEAANTASVKKQILLTTHSKIVIDAAQPESVWVIWRSNLESQMANISNIDPDIYTAIEEGDVSAFDVLDSGAIPQALPPEPHYEE